MEHLSYGNALAYRMWQLERGWRSGEGIEGLTTVAELLDELRWFASIHSFPAIAVRAEKLKMLVVLDKTHECGEAQNNVVALHA